MKRFVALVLLLAGAVAASADSNEEVRPIMSAISETLFRLLPALHARDTDPESFFADIKQLKNQLEAAGPHFQDQPDGTLVTYEALMEQITDAVSFSERHNMLMARHLLSQSFELCASCHMQDQLAKRAFGVSRFRDMDEFTAAEYSYLTRDYPSALASYRNVLDSDMSDQYQRLTALDRMMAIHLEVLGNVASALKEVTTVHGQGNEIMTLKHWEDALVRLNDEDARLSPLEPATVEALDRYLRSDWQPIESLLNQEEREVYWLLVRHRLHELLNGNRNKDELPILFYWLAVSDRSMYFQFYDSMSRRYLEQCIREFPSHPYASQCFDEYELLMIVSYSGSSGINIPPEVGQEINELRRLVHEGQR